MYEAEVNHSTESIETLPLEARQGFAEFRSQVLLRTTLPWGEHCTECMWPTCYTTCDLYDPRKDGACRQFMGGVVRLDHAEGLNPYVTKIRFKQWAKLWTVGNLELKTLEEAERTERWNLTVGAMGRSAPLPQFVKIKVLQKISYYRRLDAESAPASEARPDSFLLECFNPNERTIGLTLTVRRREQKGMQPFQEMIRVAPGYNRATVPFARIAAAVDMSQPFEVEMVPNACDNTVLYFGLMDFVSLAPVKGKPVAGADGKAKSKTFKCVVWDLDHTLWDGILIEDGPDKVRVRPGVVDVIKELDRRGILHSIASKNNFDDAMAVLRAHGLEQYFFHPQIGWQPKSQSIARIAKLLNIGVDTFAFVDDQVFEREEVKATLPEVTPIDALEFLRIPQREECQVPVTAESQSRRLMYREEQQREQAQESFQGDYFGFLRTCQLRAEIQPLTQENLKRVYELAQRTNQMNFSGNRYQEAELLEIMKSPALETYVIHCTDRFGDYGIVGFAVVDTRAPRLLDLMFSCRVQAKRVEHSILTFVLRRFIGETDRDFYANYRKTAKNAPSGKVFEEMGFELAEEKDGVSSLVFRRSREIPDDRIVRIDAQLRELANG